MRRSVVAAELLVVGGDCTGVVCVSSTMVVSSGCASWVTGWRVAPVEPPPELYSDPSAFGTLGPLGKMSSSEEYVSQSAGRSGSVFSLKSLPLLRISCDYFAVALASDLMASDSGYVVWPWVVRRVAFSLPLLQ